METSNFGGNNKGREELKIVPPFDKLVIQLRDAIKNADPLPWDDKRNLYAITGESERNARRGDFLSITLKYGEWDQFHPFWKPLTLLGSLPKRLREIDVSAEEIRGGVQKKSISLTLVEKEYVGWLGNTTEFHYGYVNREKVKNQYIAYSLMLEVLEIKDKIMKIRSRNMGEEKKE